MRTVGSAIGLAVHRAAGISGAGGRVSEASSASNAGEVLTSFTVQ